MNFRIEFNIVGANDDGIGKREFPAESVTEALSKIKKICQDVQNENNKDEKNRFYNCKISPVRLTVLPQVGKSRIVTTYT